MQWLILLKTAATATAIPATITQATVRSAWERFRMATFGNTAVRAAYRAEREVWRAQQAEIATAVKKTEEEAAQRLRREKEDIARRMITKNPDSTAEEIAEIVELSVAAIEALMPGTAPDGARD